MQNIILLIQNISSQEWVKSAFIDSIQILPFLFIIFLVIEFAEYFFAYKMNNLIKHSKKAGPLIGSLVASVPQCGFSVIASTLYTKRLITVGTLIAVYLSTSDEAIPIILAKPGMAPVVIKLIIIKILIGILAGYSINLFLKKREQQILTTEENGCSDEGCCNHHLEEKPDKKELILHPLAHTANVFFFILVVTLGINYLVTLVGGEENLGKYFLSDTVFQPVIMAFLGLIPNCAASVAITMMYLKGAIGFGSVVAGLSSSAGLGTLVLLRKNDNKKDTFRIIGLLLSISIISGIIIQFFYN